MKNVLALSPQAQANLKRGQRSISRFFEDLLTLVGAAAIALGTIGWECLFPFLAAWAVTSIWPSVPFWPAFILAFVLLVRIKN